MFCIDAFIEENASVQFSRWAGFLEESNIALNLSMLDAGGTGVVTEIGLWREKKEARRTSVTSVHFTHMICRGTYRAAADAV